ncbi:XdhC family protein [Microbacterium sp. NPDC089189]|uniref:XdhC family protein n=1 Tax=Microbacterium sp. NPDC089189 TaxID=3154972 RepID=UPI00341CAED8
MLELARDLLPLLRAGQTVATVTVVGVARSAPRGVGSAMAVTRDARVIGSISGGCVEGDAVAMALAALGRGDGDRARFGFTDEQAFAAGLACGGTIDAVISLVHPDDQTALGALERAADDRPSALGIVTEGPATGNFVASPPTVGATGIRASSDGAVLDVVAPRRPRLVLLGAGEHAAAICRVAAAAGFAVSVCDVWDTLVTAERFPAAASLHTAIPEAFLTDLEARGDIDAQTSICVLTHDLRLDIPALRVALASPAGFVGAMGARRTVARREQLLREAGMPHAQIARLHSPLGLDLGGSSPDETAIAVLAEIVAVRHGGTGGALRLGTGALHPRSSDALAPADAASCATAR